MVDWTDDRIAALSDQDLKNLLANAERKSDADVAEKCKAELGKRNALKPRSLTIISKWKARGGFSSVVTAEWKKKR